jgi:opacity protein-like surface antigen
MKRTVLAAALSAPLLVFPSSDEARAEGIYLRLGAGLEQSSSSRFSDRSCSLLAPPALFGCEPGSDGRSIGARGDFGRMAGLEIGVGYHVLPALRLEVTLQHRPRFSFSGNANFLGVPGAQPVSSRLSASSANLAAYVDLAALGVPSIGPFRPFVGGGIGASRIEIGSTTFGFPGIGPDAATIIGGGVATNLSWMLTAGVEARIAERVTLDIAWRYTDLGTIKTRDAPATIVRPSRTSTLTIAGTKAHLATHGLWLSLRFPLQ